MLYLFGSLLYSNTRIKIDDPYLTTGKNYESNYFLKTEIFHTKNNDQF